MEDNNKLIPITKNSLVEKATISIAITNKLVAENNKQMVLEIFRKNPKLFIDLISNYYPLDLNTLLEFKENLNWQLLSANENLEWDLGNENPFEKDLNWDEINLYDYLFGLVTQKEVYYLFDFSFIKWDWKELSKNKSLPWSIELIENYKAKWDWGELSRNESLPWSINLIEKFTYQWDWKILSEKENLPWSIDFFEKYIDKLDFQYLSRNESLPWSEEFFEEHFDKWCNTKARRFEKDGQNVWTYYSEKHNRIWYLGAIECIINRNGELIKTLFWVKTTLGENSLKEFIEEDIIDLNKGLIKPIQQFSLKPFYKGQEEDIYNNLKLGRYSITSLATNEDAIKLDRKFIYLKETSNIPIPQILSNKNVPFWSNLSSNKSLPWSEEFIEKHIDRWDWFNLSSNESLPWSTIFFEKYINKWDWNELSSNRNLPWSTEFIEKYEDEWNWSNLSSNENLPWSIDFFVRYDDNWNWSNLSLNLKLPWSIELIEKYEENWDWHYLSCNENLPWSITLIDLYKEKWYWSILDAHKTLPWSENLIESYEDKWDWDLFGGNEFVPWTIKLIHKYSDKIKCYKNIWEILKPFVDDEIVFELFKEINLNNNE